MLHGLGPQDRGAAAQAHLEKLELRYVAGTTAAPTIKESPHRRTECSEECKGSCHAVSLRKDWAQELKVSSGNQTVLEDRLQPAEMPRNHPTAQCPCSVNESSERLGAVPQVLVLLEPLTGPHLSYGKSPLPGGSHIGPGSGPIPAPFS